MYNIYLNHPLPVHIYTWVYQLSEVYIYQYIHNFRYSGTENTYRGAYTYNRFQVACRIAEKRKSN